MSSHWHLSRRWLWAKMWKWKCFVDKRCTPRRYESIGCADVALERGKGQDRSGDLYTDAVWIWEDAAVAVYFGFYLIKVCTRRIVSVGIVQMAFQEIGQYGWHTKPWSCICYEKRLVIKTLCKPGCLTLLPRWRVGVSSFSVNSKQKLNKASFSVFLLCIQCG